MHAWRWGCFAGQLLDCFAWPLGPGLDVGAGAIGPLWERTSRPACLGLTCGLGLGLVGPENGASVGLRLGPKLGLR